MVKAVIFDMYETLITHFRAPLYFGKEMAEDAGVPEDVFVNAWRVTEDDRATGVLPMDVAIEKVLKQVGYYSKEASEMLFRKRTENKEECFRHLHEGIIPMMEALKARGVKVALISNCFTEEAAVIRNSVLFSYFDVAMMSCEQGVKKPDEEIFYRCLKELDVGAKECVYVGDGGSRELEVAESLGMKPLQVCWYLVKGTKQPVWRLPEFTQVDDPMGVLDFCD
ncbi:MAG: HAD-IA family hydrolase [Clostridia bacterium]|nr:HAD-IA family hydrolase [Clostridia bacterium]